MLGQQLRRLGPVPLGLGELLLQRLLARLDRTEYRGPGELLENRQQQEEDDDRPEHEPALDRERAGGVLFLECEAQVKHWDSVELAIGLSAIGYRRPDT